MKNKTTPSFKAFYIATGFAAAAAACALLSRLKIFAGVSGYFGIAVLLLLTTGVAFYVKSFRGFRAAKQESDTKYSEMLDGLRDAIYGDDDVGKEKISVVSEKLGEFVYRRKPEWFEGEALWRKSSRTVKIIFPGGDETTVEKYLRFTESIFAEQKRLDREIRKRVASKRINSSQSVSSPSTFSCRRICGLRSTTLTSFPARGSVSMCTGLPGSRSVR